MNKTPVAILGATGVVGQKLLLMLANHPWFHVAGLYASAKSAGRAYKDACHWLSEKPLPEELHGIIVREVTEKLNERIVFSCVDASIAEDLEPKLATLGHIVISNASAHRLAEDIPLLIPEINSHHAESISNQQSKRQYRDGFIVTNPNCSTTVLALALAPLEKQFGLEAVLVTTAQSVSGAGYPGTSSLDILGNLIPHIPNEVEKIETETQKLLGKEFKISAQVSRVPVLEGHTLFVSVKLKKQISEERLRECLANFHGLPQELQLPTAPRHPLVVRDEIDRPQPRLDAFAENGMSVVIGQIKPCPVLDWKFTLVGNNLVRGAAGAALLNAELLHKLNWF